MKTSNKENNQIWDISSDGTIKYVPITKDLVPGTLEIMRNSFFQYENMSIGVGLPSNPEAISELEDLLLDMIGAGISVAAIDTSNDQIVGVSLNKTQDITDDNIYMRHVKNTKHPNAIGFFKIVAEAESKCDFFQLCNVDCVGEILLLTVSPDCRNRGIGTKLCQVSIDIFRKMAHGEDVQIQVFDKPVERKRPPKIVTALFTTHVTQTIGRRLDFILAKRNSYEELMFNGNSIASVIGKETSHYTLEYKPLV